MRRALAPAIPAPGGLTAPSFRRSPLGRRLLRNAGAVLGLVLLGAIAAVALASVLYVPQNPYRIAVDRRFEPPGPLHPFGTDDLGRDVFSRVMVGARISLGVAGCVLLVAGAVGVPLGILAGYRRRPGVQPDQRHPGGGRRVVAAVRAPHARAGARPPPRPLRGGCAGRRGR